MTISPDTVSSQEWASASAPGGTPKINSIFDFSAEALGQLKVYLEQAGLNLPISNIIGFQQFTTQIATPVNTVETTTSTSYTDLATVGPTLSNLPNGKYLVLFGAAMFASAGGDVAAMNISVNGAAISNDNDAAFTNSKANGMVSFSAVTVTLSNGTNEIKAKYRGNAAGTYTFFYRRLFALRYAN